MLLIVFFFFFNDTATTEIYTLSLHDALPISLNFASQAVRGGDEEACGVLGVFRLGQQVGCDPPRIALLREDHCLGGTRGQVDSAIAADNLLGGCDVFVPRPKYLVHTRHTLRAISERRDGLRPADACDSLDA